MKIWQLRSRTLRCDSIPLVMGILNVTPDSFSDGGRYLESARAVERALRMEEAGAAIIDLGAESTRPYSEGVPAEEQLQRLLPVLDQLTPRIRIPLSIDTQSSHVAARVLEYPSVEIINDVSAMEHDPELLPLVVERSAAVCLMHMRGTPMTMQDRPEYDDVVGEIKGYLRARFDTCVRAGVEAERICLDPGIGFGKTHAHNVHLLREVRAFHDLPAPILIGHSRKGFIGELLGDKTLDRAAGTLGVSLAMARAKVDLLRVHDVEWTVQALRLFAESGGLADK